MMVKLIFSRMSIIIKLLKYCIGLIESNVIFAPNNSSCVTSVRGCHNLTCGGGNDDKMSGHIND